MFLKCRLCIEVYYKFSGKTKKQKKIGVFGKYAIIIYLFCLVNTTCNTLTMSVKLSGWVDSCLEYSEPFLSPRALNLTSNENNCRPDNQMPGRTLGSPLRLGYACVHIINHGIRHFPRHKRHDAVQSAPPPYNV